MLVRLRGGLASSKVGPRPSRALLTSPDPLLGSRGRDCWYTAPCWADARAFVGKDPPPSGGAAAGAADATQPLHLGLLPICQLAARHETVQQLGQEGTAVHPRCRKAQLDWSRRAGTSGGVGRTSARERKQGASNAARQNERCHPSGEAAAAQAHRRRVQARSVGGRQAPHHLRRCACSACSRAGPALATSGSLLSWRA